MPGSLYGHVTPILTAVANLLLLSATYVIAAAAFSGNAGNAITSRYNSPTPTTCCVTYNVKEYHVHGEDGKDVKLPTKWSQGEAVRRERVKWLKRVEKLQVGSGWSGWRIVRTDYDELLSHLLSAIPFEYLDIRSHIQDH